MSAKNKVLKKLDTVLLVRDKPAASTPGSTLLALAVTAGAVVVPTTDATNFAAGDVVRVGSGETMELCVIDSISTNDLTMENPLTFAHALGEQVVEQVAYDLGEIADGGITVSGNAPSTDLLVANRRMPLTVLNGYADLAAQFSLVGFTLANLCVALGIDYTSIKGTGAAATPYSLATDGSDYGSVQNASIIAIGTLMDGTTVRVELWGVDTDFSSIAMSIVRGASMNVPVRMVAAAGGMVTTGASVYVPSTSFASAKGDVLDSLSEVGLFVDDTATTNTQLSGAVAAGAVIVPVTVATGIVGGLWVRIGTGEDLEIHQVDSIAALNVTLRTPLLRAHALGEAFVALDEVPFAGVSEAGVALEITGQLDAIRIATRRLGAGMKPGSASSVMRFALIDFTLANFARALGIAASVISSGRLPITGANIALETVVGVYAKGVLQSGRTARIHAWGCSQDVSSFAATLATQGIQSMPVAFKPSSGLHFLQHS